MWNPMMNPMMMQQPGQVVGDFFGMDRIDKDAREFCDEQNKTVVKISSLWQGVGKDVLFEYYLLLQPMLNWWFGAQ